jgi:FkbH-like protein
MMEAPQHSGSVSSKAELKQLLSRRDPRFWQVLTSTTRKASSFEEMYFCSTIRRKAFVQGFVPPEPKTKLRIALLGGYTFYPLTEIIEHLLFVNEFDAEIWVGDYDNYNWEIMDEQSSLYDFRADFIVFMPPSWRYKYSGKLSDEPEMVRDEISQNRQNILDLCDRMHKGTAAEIILCNLIPPCTHDPGEMRTRTLGSEWNSLKQLNLEVGLTAPKYVHICDLEFLSARMGGVNAQDNRAWFESKQPFSADFVCQVATELTHLTCAAKSSTKKVLVLDLDNTLWGGTIGDDGVNGIEIGDTSARGQCFKEFQKSIKHLADRGVLLAVCSKNDYDNAIEPFEKHPDMVLRKEDFVSFKANWNPKSENIIEIAQELNLSLDSLVFVDDNPAEIEIVRQFVPQVETLLLGHDPASYMQALKDCRFFEPRQITQEDLERTNQYKLERQRNDLLSSATDMETYLSSLNMTAIIDDFREVDVPRLAQLINKSNQFNLTTKRRTEAEISALIKSAEHECFSVRLKDKFGDLGLVSIIIANTIDGTQNIDTWLMSCRVLKRGVEQVALNELLARAQERGCKRIVGTYIPTAKNQMVSTLFQDMGFKPLSMKEDRQEYETSLSAQQTFDTCIEVVRRRNDKS